MTDIELRLRQLEEEVEVLKHRGNMTLAIIFECSVIAIVISAIMCKKI